MEVVEQPQSASDYDINGYLIASELVKRYLAHQMTDSDNQGAQATYGEPSGNEHKNEELPLTSP